MATNVAYEAAMAAAAAKLAVQTSWERFIAAVIAGLLAVYTAVRRVTGWAETPDLDDG